MTGIEDRAVEPLTDELLSELIAAEGELQAGPWVVWDDGDIGTGYPVEQRRQNRSTGEAEDREIESLLIFNGRSPISDQIVAIRNLLPGLLARLEGAEVRISELEEELELNRPPF